MTKVLVLAGIVPQEPIALRDMSDRLRSADAGVQLACFFDPALLETHPDHVEVRHIDIRGGTVAGPLARRIWHHARRDRWLRRQAREADVIVALDHSAVYAVWRLAHLNRYADARLGLAPALAAVEARRTHGRRRALPRLLRRGPSLTGIRLAARDWLIPAARRVLGFVTAPAVLGRGLGVRVWRAILGAPRLPDRRRAALANRVHDGLVAAGRASDAAATSAVAARRITSQRPRADLFFKAVSIDLAAGRIPADLRDAVKANTALADTLHRSGKSREASDALRRASDMLLHRSLHLDRLTSPLAADPTRYLAPLHTSTAMTAVMAPASRLTPAAPAPVDRPLRLLFATRLNSNFLREIYERYSGTPGIETRHLDLGRDAERAPLTIKVRKMIEHRLAGRTAYGEEIECWLRPHLDWADTLFIDWCMAPAVLFTMLDPGPTRIIVRLHSMEAFSLWPHLVDFSRVDDVVFVSDHLREFATMTVPALSGPLAPRTAVIPNAMDLHRFKRPKTDSARFTLGMVGAGNIAKDPRWAIHLLRLLRRRDSRYRLVLIGDGLDPHGKPALRAYHEQLSSDLAELEPSGAIHRLGRTDDVPAALTDIGVILSTSVRESFHCGLVEGAASGAVPVVRDWPFFSALSHGASTLFPSDWVVRTPEEAVSRILATTGTEQGWRDAGEAASLHAITRWDWTVTREAFDRLLLSN